MKRICSFVFFIVLGNVVSSQNINYPSWSPYGGVNNVAFNPAISDTRHIVDINLFNTAFYQSISGYSRSTGSLFPFDLNRRYAFETNNTSTPFIYESLKVQGPSILITGISKRKNNWGFGLSTFMNTSFDLRNIDTTFMRIMAFNQGGAIADSIYRNHQMIYASWNEIKPTVGYTAFNKKNHFVKVGASIRFLSGIEAFQYRSDQLTVTPTGADSATIQLQNAMSFRSEGLTMNYNDFARKANSGGRSITPEVGVIYEYRTLKENFDYSMNGNEYVDHEHIKYLFIGGISYSPAANLLYIGKKDIVTNSKTVVSFTDLSRYTKIDDLYNGVIRNFPDNETSTIKQELSLPSNLNLFADANLYKGIGVNISSVLHPAQDAASFNNIYQPNHITFAPRWDNSLMGMSFPLTWQQWSPINREDLLLAGVALRFGPLSIAAHYNVTAGQIAQINAGIKIPVRYKKLRDKDSDGVDDTKDKCIDIPGHLTAMGCPDIDLDSIPNDKDRCPFEFGPVIFMGCPDKDGDEVPDIDDRCKDDFGLYQYEGCPDNDVDCVPDDIDECPTIAGPPESNGCPDADDDGVYDMFDKCVDIAGPKEFNGCPDRDDDGILDMDDDCPDEKGNEMDGGCPDSDNDGVLDKDDFCPFEKGVWRLHGCPNEDTDLDGVYDFDDDCPEEFGLKTNMGCPKKTKFPNQKKHLILNMLPGYAFENKYFGELDSLASILQNYPNYTIMIIGYSDDVGTEDEKMNFSLQRANTCKDYMLQKGIDETRIAIRANGDKDPLDDKGTTIKHSRIEFFVLFPDE